MTVSQDKVVSISYQLNLDAPDGEFVQKVEADDPLAFIPGAAIISGTWASSSKLEVLAHSVCSPK